MLEAWLPLNKEGNFYNQGLANIIVTNSGATYNTNGKIGGCYTFGDGTSSNQYKGISINTNFSQIGESRSICAWVRPKGNHLHYSGAIVSSGDWNSRCWGFCLKQDNTGFTGFDSGYSDYYYTNIPVNNWTHLCVTVQNGITKFYKNGEYLGETSRGSGSVSSNASNTMIGRETYARGYFSFNGDISDVRIYSHALSPKEVHEIAKGLVLHYPMNDEYMESTTNLGNTSTTYSNIIFGKEYIADSWGGDAGTVTYYESGGFNNLPYKVYHKTATGTGGIYRKTANDIILEANKTYTMSIWIKASRNFSDSSYSFNINRGSDNYYINYGQSVKFTTEWTRISRTFTTNNSQAGNYGEMSIIYDNGVTDYYVYFSGFQIEEKDHMTPYTPTIRNELVYDCSGYCNNGAITGSLQVVDDSSRYKKSTKFNGINERISISSTFTKSNQLTVSLWSYCTKSNLGNKNIFSLEYNNYWQFNIANNNIYIRDSISGLTGTRRIVSFGTIPENKWNHLTTVYDKGTIKTYLNGELVNINTSTSIETLNWNNINWCCIGSAHEDDFYFNGNLSDIRIYSTALSDEDIKELYNTSAIINNNNTLETYEFSEANTYSINKSGVLEGKEFIEQDGEVQINNTEQVFATEFTEI